VNLRGETMARWLKGAALAVGLIVTLELALLLPLGNLLAEQGVPSDAATRAIDRSRLVLWVVSLAAGWIALLRVGPAPAAPPHPRRSNRDVAWLQTLLDSMSEAVVALASDGRVVFANHAAMELLGLRALPDGTPMMVLSSVPRLRSSAVQALRHHEVVERELVIPGPRRRELLLRATPTADGVVLLMLDLSGVRDLEARWRRFVADASHELRTPIAAVAANLEILEEAHDAPADRRQRMVAAASRQAQRLSQLVQELTLLVRLDEEAPPALQPIAVAEVVDTVVTERTPSDPTATERVTNDAHDVVVLAEPVGLQRVLANLIGNALRYSAGPVQVRGSVDDGRAHLEVVDEGPGIDDADKNRVFDRFYRTDDGRTRAAGGTGLGLAIVSELVERMGGSVEVRDNEPHGTIFRVTLGAAAPRPTRAAPSPAAAPPG